MYIIKHPYSMMHNRSSMHSDLLVVIIVAIIAALLLVIAGLFAASVFRRAYHERKYRKLDALQAEYRKKLTLALEAAVGAVDTGAFVTVPGSVAWQALEQVLLEFLDEQRCAGEIKSLFLGLGYVAYYENRLARRNVTIRASSVDKLGRMGCPSSTKKLLPLLDEKDPEILSVTIRALSRLGAKEGLTAIVERLPVILGGSLVTRKAMETALLNFGESAVPFLANYGVDHADPWIISCVLETLSHFPPDPQSTSLAIGQLGSPNPEVRSKALKVLGREGQPLPAHVAAIILQLLDDPVWFVRLQSVKLVSAAELIREKAAKRLEKLLFDENWRVRGEAALALTRLGTCAVDVFYDSLLAQDVYAKESICEEIEKTRFADQLIEHLDGADEALRKTSREILRLMHALHFSIPLTEYLKTGGNERIKKEIQQLLEAGAGR